MKQQYKKMIPVLLISAMLLAGCGAADETAAASQSAQTIEESNPGGIGDTAAEDMNAQSIDSTLSASKGQHSTDSSADTADAETEETSAETSAADQEYFSDRDLSGEVDTSNAVSISLNRDSISADSDTVSINGTTATITEEGTYILTGSLEDGSIVVDAAEDAKIH